MKRETLQNNLGPPMAAPKFIENSELSYQEGDQKGWLAVDKFTLQHNNFKNIFGLGDVTGIPNSKTGAAIRKQYPVVAENIMALINNKPITTKYDGYSSCPLITEVGKVMLAEFGYDSKLMPTFPLAPDVPRRSMWYLKKYLLPILYWKVMLKGRG
jgi:sulfide:quinone oxidoreductase